MTKKYIEEGGSRHDLLRLDKQFESGPSAQLGETGGSAFFKKESELIDRHPVIRQKN